MLKKGNRLYSIFKRKCPRCHEGDFFVSTPYNLKHAGELHKTCSNCALKYEKVPGVYYGAMYVSYGLGVALFVALWVLISLFFPNLSTGLQIFLIISVSLILTPYLYALSKIIWANLFVKYDRARGSEGAN